MKKIVLLSLTLIAKGVMSQCVDIVCPGDITVPVDPGMCTAIVTYSTPVGVSSCGTMNDTIYSYTGAPQTFTVPPGITSINVEAFGAQGGNVNVSCTATGGLGAHMTGDFAVTPGEIITIVVGQQGITNGSDGGGGGGTYVVAAGNIPLIIAGGGGGASNNIGSCGVNLNGINASITENGTASANGTIAGGTAGNGGGASSGSGGGGGGFFTDGTGGTGTPTSGGKSYLNGSAGGFGNSGDFGGYGGGGAGWFVGGNGGGGGGYSGGGTDGAMPYSGGGGGGSYNAGTNQINTAGVQTGNGQVIITYGVVDTVYTTMILGLTSGSAFPQGITEVKYIATDSLGSDDTCSFFVTVNDNEAPVLTCPGDQNACSAIVNGIGVIATDCIGVETVTFDLTGATTLSGVDDASGSTFNMGATLVTYVVIDSSGNADTCSFTVTRLNCLSVDENGLSNLQVYPNPTQGNTTIALGADYQKVSLTMTSATGQVVYSQEYEDKNTITLSLEELPAGIYFVVINADDENKTVRLVRN